ncbi:unnamed protein product [Clonostachys rosea]|uniref:NADH:flavin oxidoreductase/NADH oxidase N-terminal domain-containing protein n=1 Tax=Bionectria ochroleuca TaxID=29856 RepID=A0ABY6UPL8_BIOOC|nr:unnamed protein product [Clonostachys rosea]
MQTTNLNPEAEAPFFTPKHAHSPGQALETDKNTSTLFQPLTIRNVTLRNRIIVSPMCQYSVAPSGTDIGKLTDFHIATLGHYAIKGAGLVFIEATSVQPNGRITPNCPGLWSDEQIGPIKRVVDFVHSQGGLCAIQLGHAGRKASTVAPWVASKYRRERGYGPGSVRSTSDVGGWPDNVVGPMGGEEETWDGLSNAENGGYFAPRGLTLQDIEELVQDFGRSAARAVKAGVDIIEIHSAHGYLLHQFLSPVTNRRTDRYGGSFENRTRFAKEIIAEVRRNIPRDMPLFFRVSCTDWLEGSEAEKKFGGSWDVESTIRLAKELPDLGIDLLDVSSGGNHKDQNMEDFRKKDYQTSRAGRIRQAIRKEGTQLLIGAVGLITEADDARELVQGAEGGNLAEEAQIAKELTQANSKDSGPKADVILVARQFLREPEWVLKVAWQLGVEVAWPSQFARAKFSLK